MMRSIVDAIRNSDLDGLRLALRTTGSVDEVDEKGYTALHWAAEYLNLPCIEILINANCKVDARNKDGATALYLACYKRLPLMVVKRLLEACPDCVHITNKEDITPLMVASSFCDADVVELLISYKADVNRRDRNGKTALWHARSCLRAEIEGILLRAGADRETGFFSVLEAARYGYPNAVREAIERGCSVDETSTNLRNTALHYVALDGEVSDLRLLLSAGCPPSKRNKEGETPLFMACVAGSSLGIVQSLLEADISCVNISNNSGVYPLMEVSLNSDAKVVQALIKAGAELNVLKDGYSALWDAQVGNRLDVYHILLEAGANPMIGCDLSFYFQYLYHLLAKDPESMIKILKMTGADLVGDVKLKMQGLCKIKQYTKALTTCGVNVHYLDINDPSIGVPDALTIRLKKPDSVERLWLASLSCAIEPFVVEEHFCMFSLKDKCRSIIRRQLAHQVRSEKIFEYVLKQLEIPVDLQLFLRYLKPFEHNSINSIKIHDFYLHNDKVDVLDYIRKVRYAHCNTLCYLWCFQNYWHIEICVIPDNPT